MHRPYKLSGSEVSEDEALRLSMSQRQSFEIAKATPKSCLGGCLKGIVRSAYRWLRKVGLQLKQPAAQAVLLLLDNIQVVLPLNHCQDGRHDQLDPGARQN